MGVGRSSDVCGSDGLVASSSCVLTSLSVDWSVRLRPVPSNAVLRREPFRFRVLVCFKAAAIAPPVARGLLGEV